MGYALSLVSLFGFIGFLVWLLVSLIRRSGAKKPLIGMLMSVILFFVGIASIPSPPTEPSTSAVIPAENEIIPEKSESEPVSSEITEPVQQQKPLVDREESKRVFSEIRAAYKANELAAEDKYKGKTYTLIGTLNGITDSGLNKLSGTITATIEIKDGNTVCYIFCSFDKSYREDLKKYSVGDEMIFKGECSSWGSWTKCELIKE